MFILLNISQQKIIKDKNQGNTDILSVVTREDAEERVEKM